MGKFPFTCGQCNGHCGWMSQAIFQSKRSAGNRNSPLCDEKAETLWSSAATSVSQMEISTFRLLVLTFSVEIFMGSPSMLIYFSIYSILYSSSTFTSINLPQSTKNDRVSFVLGANTNGDSKAVLVSSRSFISTFFLPNCFPNWLGFTQAHILLSESDLCR